MDMNFKVTHTLNRTQIHCDCVDRALSYLNYDRQYPDVGMPMFAETAIKYAIRDFCQKYKVSEDIFDDYDMETINNLVKAELRKEYS